MSADRSAVADTNLSARHIDARLWWIVVALIIGTWLPVLDTTMVNIALKSLSEELHTDLDEIQWVVTAYLLSMAAVIPVTGWAARRLGAKRVYLASVVFFAFGSALCGLAGSAGELILFRVVQGLGGGVIVPVAQMLLVKAAGPARLARVMSAWLASTVLAPVVGPTIGGFLLESAGWRWIFYVNIPISVVAVLVGLLKLPSEAPETVRRFDVVGLVLAATGLVATTYGLAQAGSPNRDVTNTLVALIAGMILVAAFVVRALHVEHPLLDMRLYADRAFAAAQSTTFFIGVAMFGALILMPLYFQTVRNESTVDTGLLLAPPAIGSAAAMWAVARMTDRFGAGVAAAVGATISLIAIVPFVMIGADTPYPVLVMMMFFQGFAFTFALVPAMTAAFLTLRPGQINDAAPQQNIIERVSGSLGVAIMAVVLQNHLTHSGPSATDQAAAFASTFWWVLGLTAVALVPTAFLLRAGRRHGARTADHDGAAEMLVGAPSLTE